MKRRAPQILSSLTQPFDDKVFNFTKLHGQEFMFHVVHNSLENGSGMFLPKHSVYTRIYFLYRKHRKIA